MRAKMIQEVHVSHIRGSILVSLSTAITTEHLLLGSLHIVPTSCDHVGSTAEQL